MKESLDIIDKLVKEMESLLNCDLPYRQNSYKNGVDQRLGEIVRCFESMQANAEAGSNEAAEEIGIQGRMKYLKVKMLRNNLRCIAEYDAAMLKKFQKRLQDPDYNNYFGTRLEVMIAANLIRKDLNFKLIPSSNKHQSPDFEVCWEGCKLFVECTNSHYALAVTSTFDPRKKLEFSINEKAKKAYAGTKTALFLDFTDVHSHSTDDNHLLQKPDYFSKFSRSVEGAGKFGSILAFTYSFDDEKEIYSYSYIREDTEKADGNLLSFLDAHFPKTGIVLSNSLIPLNV